MPQTPRPVVDPRVLGVVVLGGIVGVAGRAALTIAFGDGVIFGINEFGSFLLGVVVGWLGHGRPLARAFLGTGVLGGFTTYSGFAVAVAASVAASPVMVLGIALLSIVGGVLGAAIGLWIGGRFAREGAAPEDAE